MQKTTACPDHPTGGFYIFQPVTLIDQNQVVSHTDYTLGSRDRISFLYFMDNIPQTVGRTTATLASQASIFPTRHQNFTLRYTHIFSSNLLNEFHATYNRDAFGVSDPRRAVSRISISSASASIWVTRFHLWDNNRT